ncbi:MAG: hypothetical protein DCF19_15445 [Pseudanabaena frigida]|uniref:Glycosyl transferase family 1 domain-containing protein n=1 Tax=Pseudanabaena frigida TaxID=945775 RepID=A0A2W4W2R9_9CYAN|nr:MAG: hypothetical protein DCF19_15445 [Pseudanabaena frigida]
MKLKILNLLSDEQMEGIKSSLSDLITSRLAEKYEFAIAPLKRAKASLHNWQPDIIIIHDPCSWGILPYLITLKFIKGKAKLVIQDRHYSANFERIKITSTFVFRLMLRLCHWCADRLLLVSHAQGVWMKKHKLVRSHKVTVIRQCQNCDRFLSLEPKTIEKPLTLAAYGNFIEQKGFDILLQAVGLIPYVQFQLKIAGSGSDEAALHRLAEGNSKVQFVGQVEDIPAFLNDCDVVVIPSRWEPWGDICLEAKAASKSVIVSAVDGLVEQVQDFGYLVPPADPQSLAKAIARVCEMPPEDLKAQGMDARESVINAWDDYLDEWETLLCQLLKE